MKTALRLPRSLHRQLLDASTESGKSLNAEIIARLAASFDAPGVSDVLQAVVRLQSDVAAIRSAIPRNRKDD